jgi:hypothetical protein
MNDKDLLNLYHKGWNDELNQTIDKSNKSKAYLMGREDCLIGDEIESRDLLSKKDILLNIRGSKILIWLDDTRNPFENNWLNFSPIPVTGIHVEWVKSYDEFVEYITLNGLPEAICFDHDLGFKIDPNVNDVYYHNGEISDYCLLPYQDEEKTGYDCVKWLCNYCLEHNLNLPKWNIQSSNTVGKENMKKYLENFELSKDQMHFQVFYCYICTRMCEPDDLSPDLEKCICKQCKKNGF